MLIMGHIAEGIFERPERGESEQCNVSRRSPVRTSTVAFFPCQQLNSLSSGSVAVLRSVTTDQPVTLRPARQSGATGAGPG